MLKTACMGSRMDVVELVDAEGLAASRDEWFELWRCGEAATPFQSPDWLLPWTRRYAGERCRAMVVRRNGALLGLLPVFVWRRTLLLAGAGPSDYGDGLFRPGAEDWASELVARAAGMGGFDRIDFMQLREGSPLLSARPPEGWASFREAHEVCPVLRLSGEDGMANASKRWRANWRYAMRRIAREGGSFDVARPADAAASLAALKRVTVRRWRMRGAASVLADPLLLGFLEEAVVEMATAGLLRLHRLRLGRRTIALALILLGHGEAHYYLGGFDPDFAALSPGTALVGSAISAAACEGAAEFHFLRGRESYKYRWGAVDRATHRLIFVRR